MSIAEITTGGFVEGIDFSVAMLKQASKVNKHHILNGKVRLQRRECSSLLFDNESFDKLCSTNTLYFWKEPDKYLQEMFRVIKSGGKIVIGFRDDKQMSILSHVGGVSFEYFSRSQPEVHYH
jgi:ubiquinone/menaquinone biosynthesis C-methylase UbiE